MSSKGAACFKASSSKVAAWHRCQALEPVVMRAASVGKACDGHRSGSAHKPTLGNDISHKIAPSTAPACARAAIVCLCTHTYLQ